MAFVERFKGGPWIPTEIMAPVIDFEKKTRFKQPLSQFIDPDCRGWANLLDRSRVNKTDDGFTVGFALDLLRRPCDPGSFAVNGCKDVLRLQPVDRCPQGISAHSVSFTKSPFAGKPIGPQPVANPIPKNRRDLMNQTLFTGDHGGGPNELPGTRSGTTSVCAGLIGSS